MIKFSILVPVYNVEEYIDECIQSVLNQTYKNYELILVDDGSKDLSGSICDRYAQNNDQIKVYHKSNNGLIHTRRYAIERASGDYYVTLDSDDKLETNALEIIAEAISRNNCDLVVYKWKRLIGDDVIEPSYHIEEGYVDDRRIIQKRILLDSNYNSLCLKCAKASLFTHDDYSQYYHIQHSEDLLQSLELLKKCQSAEFIDKSLYIYRLRMSSIVNEVPKIKNAIDFTVREKVIQFVAEERLFTEDDINELRDYYIGLFIDQIKAIGSSNASRREKIEAYHKIRGIAYYTDFISKGIRDGKGIALKNKLIYYMFKCRLDDLLLLTISTYRKQQRTK